MRFIVMRHQRQRPLERFPALGAHEPMHLLNAADAHGRRESLRRCAMFNGVFKADAMDKKTDVANFVAQRRRQLLLLPVVCELFEVEALMSGLGKTRLDGGEYD